MDFTFFNQLMVILVTSVCIISIFHRLNLPESLGYLATGILIGPNTFGITSSDFDISLLAEIGVVFLLFTLGLEFSVKKVKSMKREVLGLGSFQVLLCMGSMLGIFLLFGLSYKEALIISAALSLSSTAIVSKELTKTNTIRSQYGQLSISILIFQDICAVVFLILLTTLSSAESEVYTSVFLALAKGILFVAVMLLAGKRILPLLFKEIAKTRSEELFVLFALIVALFSAWLTHYLDLSMALGGFVAGMMLGESNYKHQVEAEIRPFRDILLGLFFVSIGLMLNVESLSQHWRLILIGTLGLLIIKFLIISLLVKASGENKNTSIKTGLILCQGGEFCFALITLATYHEQLTNDIASVVFSVTILSMIAAPVLIRNIDSISRLSFRRIKSQTDTENNSKEIEKQAAEICNHTLICGYGRVGQTISRFLVKENLPYVAIDDDAMHVHEAGIAGEPVFFGDCLRMELLLSVGLNRAKQVVICIDNVADSVRLVKMIRSNNKTLPIIVRTKYLVHGKSLKQAGATLVIPEVLESSLVVVRNVLGMLGLDQVIIEKKIQNARKKEYNILSGYYPGVTDFIADEKTSLFCHAILIPMKSKTIGQSIEKIVKNKNVSIMSIKRNNVTYDPEQIELIKAHDIVILNGIQSEIEEIEKNI